MDPLVLRDIRHSIFVAAAFVFVMVGLILFGLGRLLALPGWLIAKLGENLSDWAAGWGGVVRNSQSTEDAVKFGD